jgi:hypothetical protein
VIVQNGLDQDPEIVVDETDLDHVTERAVTEIDLTETGREIVAEVDQDPDLETTVTNASTTILRTEETTRATRSKRPSTTALMEAAAITPT